MPQGVVLSCTLFIVKMNILRSSIPCTIFYSVYADDVQIGFKSCNLAICEQHVQLGLNRVSNWANENGFKLNPQKTSCVLSKRRGGLVPGADIELDGQRIPLHTEHKFLGVILNSKLSFIPHVKYIKNKCLTTMIIISFVAHNMG